MNSNQKYVKLFIIEQCLQFGYQTTYTNKKLNNYIYITKEKNEIFNLYDLRAMILKLYPLMNALFHKSQYHYTIKFRNFQNKKDLPILEKKNYIPIQILFATTTPKLKDIIKETANICRMPFSIGRWLNGSLTATLTQKTINWRFVNKFHWHPKTLVKHKHIKNCFKNIENFSLIVIPDAPNNKMILNEAHKKNIPTLGLLNSSDHVDLHYAVFGDYNSTYVVSFFCNLLANLILKESILSKYRESLNTNLKLHTLYINNQKRHSIKKTQLSRYFFNYLKTIKLDNKIKRNNKIAIKKYSNILKKIFFFYNNSSKQKITLILKRYISKLFPNRFLHKNKKKINLFWMYKVWKKKWPYRPWSSLRYFNDLSIFFIAFKHTKVTNYWRNKTFAIRKYNKKLTFLKKFGIPLGQYRLFTKYCKKK